MKKTYASLLSVLFLFGILCWMYFDQMPRSVSDEVVPLSEFSTKRAMAIVKEISKEPHYVGSENHETVSTYLQKELQALGLETEIQQGTTLTDWGNLVKSKNIIARIKGTTNGKALLLLSHYDSAPHSYSYGAGDDASGLAVILESVRAYLHNKTAHKNDIFIVFTDAEELGLNGAALFVTQSKWAKQIGLALNFEARGTQGPGYMLMEVNNGNDAMVEGFDSAGAAYPVSNSLMYSIYKMLPNDTDLTVFREQGKIQGFNFAFIDGHYNYHTAQDDFNHLSPETVAHQGSYLVPLLQYFSNTDLNNLDSDDDQVYYNTPIGFFHYPFSWNFGLLTIAFVFFLFLVFVGMGKRLLSPAQMGKGFILFFGALATSGLIGFFGWRTILAFYPHYPDILQGFTYNGHWYIAAFVLLSLGIAFLWYARTGTENSIGNFTVAPLLVWLLINLGLMAFLPGAGFFIIPVFFSLLMFGFYIATQHSSPILNMIFAIPAFFVYVPFVLMFPIGLGLKILYGSAALTILIFGLLLPLFASFPKKGLWSALFIVASVGCFAGAHSQSEYAPGKAKPNSLLYIYDADADRSVWTTYDKNLDDWTRNYLTENPKDGSSLSKIPLFSKYNSTFTYTYEAMLRDIPEPYVDFLTDTVIGNQRHLTIKITPTRTVNRYDIFANENMVLHNLKANGAGLLGQKGSAYPRKGRKLVSYYVVDNEALTLQFSIPKGTNLDMELLESSFDLMTNPLFIMKKRADWMMPTPFVLTDAICIKKKIAPTPKTIIPLPTRRNFELPSADNDTIPDMDSENEYSPAAPNSQPEN
ncbi:M28 family peptidase [Flavobacterium selenitireducens]|uniref:M28 family peptidase n=1 Tax=Flavobacterium selenitireducens TaxID=2722704 RepID=UPI001CC2F63A|nr:M28 family peptidase [Flavobacterium selenitireducens]